MFQRLEIKLSARARGFESHRFRHKSLEPQWFQGISFLLVPRSKRGNLRNGAHGAGLVVPNR